MSTHFGRKETLWPAKEAGAVLPNIAAASAKPTPAGVLLQAIGRTRRTGIRADRENAGGTVENARRESRGDRAVAGPGDPGDPAGTAAAGRHEAGDRQRPARQSPGRTLDRDFSRRSEPLEAFVVALRRRGWRLARANRDRPGESLVGQSHGDPLAGRHAPPGVRTRRAAAAASRLSTPVGRGGQHSARGRRQRRRSCLQHDLHSLAGDRAAGRKLGDSGFRRLAASGWISLALAGEVFYPPHLDRSHSSDPSRHSATAAGNRQ